MLPAVANATPQTESIGARVAPSSVHLGMVTKMGRDKTAPHADNDNDARHVAAANDNTLRPMMNKTLVLLTSIGSSLQSQTTEKKLERLNDIRAAREDRIENINGLRARFNKASNALAHPDMGQLGMIAGIGLLGAMLGRKILEALGLFSTPQEREAGEIAGQILDGSLRSNLRDQAENNRPTSGGRTDIPTGHTGQTFNDVYRANPHVLSQPQGQLNRTSTEGRRMLNPDRYLNARELAIGAAGRELQARGLVPDENYQFGGVHSNTHRSVGHGRYAIDVNAPGDITEASDPHWRPIFDRIALEYQARGYRVIWNRRVYDPFEHGPNNSRSFMTGTPGRQHINHMHIEGRANSLVGRQSVTPPPRISASSTAPTSQSSTVRRWQRVGNRPSSSPSAVPNPNARPSSNDISNFLNRTGRR